MEQTAIRRRNLETVWNALVRQKQATRQSLADETGLSLMTISSFVAMLDERHALSITQELDMEKTRRPLGRRVQWIEPTSERCGWFVINLTGFNFRAVELKLNAEPRVPELIHTYDDAQSYERNLEDFLARVRGMDGVAGALGTAVITPGPYDIATDTVRNARIPALNAIHIKETIRGAIPCRNVFVEEDVKLSIRAFLPNRDARRGDLLSYIYMGEGVGGAVAYQGEVLRGLNAVAGDFGQTVGGFGRPGTLGASGGSDASYESALTIKAFASRLPGVNPDAPTANLLKQIQSYQLEGAKKGAYAALSERLAQMIYNMMWCLDPTRIVIECLYATESSDIDYFRRLTIAALRRIISNAPLNLPDIQFVNPTLPSVLFGAVQALSRQWIADVAADADGGEGRGDELRR
ncbi:MAG: ROK family protein [Oscillospiraceae bacterium]|jgi:predicted NBD/HSP70 family sugar kinase|nr:ROK family protein [Oscillospiraceae bacterium]